ncbi:MAG TPA: cell division topological specificity factor MinE [Synergistaceae bacterium]|nr:cell division topological specificity factor MinE [Synergistaceae bacterium]NLL41140.1 cell division topological specificity factor MinE [Synergistaceae bacterium]HPX03816.1 cell division topological specificity factor MinE [Synergistaceae bacterium]HQA53926.1 cell division topological specificity factor MinE [Synergistaceae bacterium]
MFDFLKNLFSGEKSGDVAKERLQLVLIHDRNDIAPEKLEALKVDMVSLLKKYLEIDEMGIRMELERRNKSVALVADIPLKSSQRQIRGRKKNG